jgi:hypothetical protein
MLIVFRPSFEVVREGRILKKIKQLFPKLRCSYLAPVLTQTGDASLIRMLTASVSIWCQFLTGF